MLATNRLAAIIMATLAVTCTAGDTPSVRMTAAKVSSSDYGVAALRLSKKFFPEIDVEEGSRALDAIATRINALLSGQPDPHDPRTRIAAINTVLYRELGFHYDGSDMMGRRLENRTLGTLLKLRAGSCANLPDLYYSVAQRLGFPIYLAEGPQHAYLRYDTSDDQHINIEATSGGSESTDDYLVRTMDIPPPAIKGGWMMRPLSRAEAFSLLIAAEGEMYLLRGNHEKAREAWQALIIARPEAGTGWWNLALEDAVQARKQSDPALLARALEEAKQAKARGLPPPLRLDYAEHQDELAKAGRAERQVIAGPTQVPAWDPVREIEQMKPEHSQSTSLRPPSHGPARAIAPELMADLTNLENAKQRNAPPRSVVRVPRAISEVGPDLAAFGLTGVVQSDQRQLIPGGPR